MNNDDAKYDETESVGGSMIRVNFREWIWAPQFEYLNGAPTDEGETCGTLSPEGTALERHQVKGRHAKRFISTSYSSLDEFKKDRRANELLFFHVYENRPSDALLKLFSAQEENETLLLLDVAKDRGFLKSTPITIEINADHRFISKPLAELRGLGAWARRGFFGFEQNEAEIGPFIATVRAFERRTR